jgi:serine/threonine protein phosphatase PrpC
MKILRRLFASNQAQSKHEETQEMPLVESLLASDKTTAAHSSSHDLQIGMASDPGRIREHNEDASLAWQFMLAQQGQAPIPVGVFAVADGMGGHTRGELASALAIRLAANHVINKICLPMLTDDEGTADRLPINEILDSGMRIAHQAVAHNLPEAGTTLTMALVLGDGAYIAHVGDSRAYLGQRSHLQHLTQDHSVAARLIEMGHATPEEAISQRNILFKAVGQGAQIEPDIVYHDLTWGQYLLICCDGLWGKVSDQEIAAIIEAAPSPDIACQNLVARANENGGEDNISVVLVARGWPPPAQPHLEQGEHDGV